jgi:hypothetical protein
MVPNLHRFYCYQTREWHEYFRLTSSGLNFRLLEYLRSPGNKVHSLRWLTAAEVRHVIARAGSIRLAMAGKNCSAHLYQFSVQVCSLLLSYLHLLPKLFTHAETLFLFMAFLTNRLESYETTGFSVKIYELAVLVLCGKIESHPCNMPWRPIVLRDVEDPTMSRQSAHS